MSELKNVTMNITMEEWEELFNAKKQLERLKNQLDDEPDNNKEIELFEQNNSLINENHLLNIDIEDTYKPEIQRLNNIMDEREKKYDIILINHSKMNKKIEQLKRQRDELKYKLEQIKNLI